LVVVSFKLLYHPDVSAVDIPAIDTKMKERIKKVIETRLLNA